MGLLRDVLLQDLAFGRLRVSEIHHFIQELVDDHKVVSDRFFFEFFKVFREDL